MSSLDFVFPDKKLFPISTPEDIKRAIDGFAMFSKDIVYEDFIYNLGLLAEKKGPEFVRAIPSKVKRLAGLRKDNEPERELNYKPKTAKKTERRPRVIESWEN